jgi:hypothetical protein
MEEIEMQKKFGISRSILGEKKLDSFKVTYASENKN